jgi:AcrR family transcriptional regulator
MTIDQENEPKRRTGGRSARVMDAVAEAVLAQLATNGIENFSIPQVAARAGISNSSLYRRWPTKAALIAFAGSRNAQSSIAFPDRGSLREDLLYVMKEVARTFQDPRSRALIAMAFGSVDSPEVDRTQSTYWKSRVEQQQAMFDRALARGEINAATDTAEIIERAIGPLYFRYFVTRRPITTPFLKKLVDFVLARTDGP